MEEGQRSAKWYESILNRRTMICVFTGFASGMPLYVLFQLLPAFLRDQGVGLKEIGLFALVTFPYTWKFVWAPFLDSYAPPFLGRRRSWMLITQVLLLVSIACLGSLNPEFSIGMIAYLALAVAFFSASQDVVIDAYRREILPDEELGWGNSVHVQAYRISGLVPGALGLILADIMPWSSVFVVVALFMLVGIGMTLVIKEPDTAARLPTSLKETVTQPFIDFIKRFGWKPAITALCFMFLYKLGDNMATALSTPFYIDLGFELTEIGVVAKSSALWASIVGGILGGLWMIKLGINRALWIFGVVQVVTILGFAALSEIGANSWVLAIVISLEYLGVGLGTAAFTAYIARSTSVAFAATQFALFTALAALPRTFANATTGYIVEAVGWTDFFLICAVLSLPGMVLLWWLAPWRGDKKIEAV
ncbi:AmpG family muropeptide MFS transporter [Neptunomonas phycophila]|jgi:PAT family beta-lactamase induction signal transducer AmpG|uniref:AmpG family muropeptide MFS transporter n=1 Tax=Neptunomonas phycophila TaxID=1572645 RepID=A0AAW7XEP4_9GAMM|nr:MULTISPECIES: AmpG family muropeptide MFS transporter [Neptunomonas]MDN2661368.1 AmpG family muropeptide MFS transporter [Neptunomonas sp. CHC150]MDO6452684.1 AmpG family muropeptide MFS transporter [Neptunomonas phycophila]